jgi:hypothetical protein
VEAVDFRPDRILARHRSQNPSSRRIRRGGSTDVRRTCGEFLVIASDFYEVPARGVRVLAARPLRVREQWTTELFGDYSPETMLTRLWMRTAVRKAIKSFGTFLSTLCHEFCHHLDFQKFEGAILNLGPFQAAPSRSCQAVGSLFPWILNSKTMGKTYLR